MSFAASIGFGDVDTGLVMEQDPETEIRCELLTFTNGSQADAAEAVLAAADLLKQANGVVPAQPGTLLPDVVKRTQLSTTLTHGALVAPTPWGGQVPQVQEDRRITLLAQLVLISDEEYQLAREKGVDALLTRLRRRAVNPNDWQRPLD
ncbi:suppressor of fused domain protein [Corynebacterium tapiri]|nr:suppressor of fused domain protein [Corynebacterium tapiri]